VLSEHYPRNIVDKGGYCNTDLNVRYTVISCAFMIEILQHLIWLVILYFHHLPVEYCDIILWHSASVNMHAIWTNICSWFQISIHWTLWCFILCNSWNSVTNSLILLSVNTLQMLRVILKSFKIWPLHFEVNLLTSWPNASVHIKICV
jgi:hypothetical protein